MEQCLNLIVFIWMLGRVSRNRGRGREGGGGVLDTPHCTSQPSISSCFLSDHYIRSDFFFPLPRGCFYSMVLHTDSAIIGQTAQYLDGLTDGLQIHVPIKLDLECLGNTRLLSWLLQRLGTHLYGL